MRVAIIGAGPAGITAAYQLARHGVSVEVFEASAHVGGMSRTFVLWGQKVDLGPHRFFSRDRFVNQLWRRVVGDDYRLVDRRTRIHYRECFFDYPLRPANVFGNLGVSRSLGCIASYLWGRVRPETRENRNQSFESWVVGRFGRRLFDMFIKSYSEKLWGIPCRELDADFAVQRIQEFSLGEAVKSALGFSGRHHRTLIDQFAYPTGGTGMVYERMARGVRELGGLVHLRRPVRRIVHRNGRVRGVDLERGRVEPFDHVVSTMPLTSLVCGLGDPPSEVARAAAALRYRNTLIVYLNVDRRDLFPDQWLYIHSPDLRVGRITNFRNWVPELYGQAGTSILALEYWCDDEDEDWRSAAATLIGRAEREVRATGLLGDAAVLDGHVVRIRRCYPVYTLGYRRRLAPIIEYLRGFEGLSAIGRCGAFKYNNQDHSILMGLLAAENILEGRAHDLWAVNSDATYQEAAEVDGTGLARNEAPFEAGLPRRQASGPGFEVGPVTPPGSEPLQSHVYRLFGLRREGLRPLERLLLAAVLLLSLAAFLVSLRDVRRYAGIDLRNRVVGARVMLAGHNPYTFFWRPGMPLEWLDPVHDRNKHRLTVPPTALWLYAPTANLPYRAQRTIFCFMEWTALAVSLALLARLIPSLRLRVVFLVAGTLFIVLGDVWRMHVERGQIYVFHLLALSAGAWLLTRDRPWASGSAFGAACLLRLNLLVLVPAFVLAGRWRTAVAALGVFLAGFAITLPLLPVGTWQGYLDVGNQYYVDLWDPERLPPIPPPPHQGPVEGFDFNDHLREITSNSFPVVYQRLQLRGFPLLDLGLVCKGLLAAFSLALLGLTFPRRGARSSARPPVHATLLLLLTWALGLEYLLPQRWAYVDILLLLPLALATPVLLGDSAAGVSVRRGLAAFLVFTGLAAGSWMPTYLGLFGTTIIRSWFVMGAVTLVAVRHWLETRIPGVSRIVNYSS